MKIYSWNVNGLRAAAEKGFSDWVTQTQPDILCLQEIKATPDQLPGELINIPGYSSFFNPAERKGYSGTAVYYKKALEGQGIRVEDQAALFSTGLSEDRFNHEGRTIRMDLPEFTIFNIYFPNGGQGDERLQFKMDFYDCFLKDVNALAAAGRKVIICGDVNTAHQEIDLKNPKTNAKRSGFLPMERRWMDHFFSEGYIDTYRYFYPDKVEYSWWSYRFNARANNAGWRIDYFFASENAKDLLADAAIHTTVQGSDHCPISLTLTI